MNKIYSVITNALVANQDGRILISQRSFEEEHEPGKWTIPGGKIENNDDEKEIFNVIEKTLSKEVMEEVGVEISGKVQLVTNNTFERSTGQMVLAMVFLTEYKSGDPKPLEDTIDVQWVSKEELDQYTFPPNVKEYILAGFAKLDEFLK
ncbi:MAG TPA: NUDIX domain-containing protein [Candidatus Woesebacteria bacterium]|nr:NUDIX domain-containing protein [Candidatus Woesebacteria bacterium]